MRNSSTSLSKKQFDADLIDFPSSSSRAHTHAAADQEKEVEFACDAHPPLVPAGVYDVIFVRAERKRMWNTEKLFLWFHIASPGDFSGATLWMACNGPRSGKVGLSSKFYQAWCIAAGRRPDRLDRLSTRIFREKVFLAQVRAVTTNSKGSQLPAALQYSIIDHLVQC